MCTVTYVPTVSGYYLTSNRDEKNTRSKALLPTSYNIDDIELIFPKDVDKGGTWIVLKKNGDSLCLLNGAFEKFLTTREYMISRGNIVVQIAISKKLINTFADINLLQTAPFTLIIVCDKKLFECKWDGKKKHSKQLDNNTAHIWSSATLYNTVQQAKRQQWFHQWLIKNTRPTQKDLYNFHKNTGNGNADYSLIMNRNNKYFTVSITSIEVNNEVCLMHYQDIIQHEYNTTHFAYQRTSN